MISRLLKYRKQYSDTFNLFGIFVCTVIVYWPVYKFRFLHGWDDQWAILNTFTENGFTWSNSYAVLTTFYGGQYAPVNQFYYMVMYCFFAYDPMYYHIGSVVIHLINIVLVYYLLKKIAGRLIASNDMNVQTVAGITALLFAVSPFNLEPVVWAAAAKVILYALFYLSALYTYCRYLETKRALYFYLTIVFFIISFGAKEQAVTLPFCLLLIDYVYNRNLGETIIWLEKLPFLIISFLFGYVSIQSQGKELFEASTFYPFYQRVVLAFYTTSEYLTKTIIPVNLSYLYPFPFQIGDPIPLYLWFYPIAITIFILAFFRAWLRHKWLVFGVVFFLIHIVFVINLLSLARFSVVADRYVYISGVGVYFMLAVWFTGALKNKRIKKRITGLGAIYLIYFMVYAHIHTYVWPNALTLKRQLKKTIQARGDYSDWEIKNANK